MALQSTNLYLTDLPDHCGPVVAVSFRRGARKSQVLHIHLKLITRIMCYSGESIRIYKDKASRLLNAVLPRIAQICAKGVSCVGNLRAAIFRHITTHILSTLSDHKIKLIL